MSNVALSIGGRNFTVACAAGEEEHIADLGRMIDAKLGAMGDMTGQSESRMLLFAALLMADELHDAHAASPPATSAMLEGTGERLEAIAVRLENLATHLEG